MRFDSVEFAQGEIKTNGVTGVSVWDAMDAEKIGYFESAKASDCAAYVEQCAQQLHGPFIVRGWTTESRSAKGGKLNGTGRNADFRWRINGKGSEEKPAAAANPPSNTSKEESPLPFTLMVELAELRVKNQYLAQENAELKHMLDAVADSDDDDDDDDSDGAGNAMAGTPAPDTSMRDMMLLMREFFGKGTPAPAPAMNGTQGATPVDAPMPADASAEEARLLRAFRRAQAVQPAATKEFADQLLTNYPDGTA